MARSLSWMDVSGLDASAWDPGTYFWQFVNRIKTKKSHIQMIHFKPKTKCIHILFCNFCFMNTFPFESHLILLTLPMLLFILQPHLVVFRGWDEEEDGSDRVEALEPAPPLRALPANIHHLEGHVLDLKVVLMDALCGLSGQKDVLLAGKVVLHRDRQINS